MQLTPGFVPRKHHFFHLPEDLGNRILEGRMLFKEKISTVAPGAISFCQMSEYMYARFILTNIFFGNLKGESQEAQERLNTCIHQLLIQEDSLDDIIKLGMQHSVGTKGINLSGGQRQKLAIAKYSLKVRLS